MTHGEYGIGYDLQREEPYTEPPDQHPLPAVQRVSLELAKPRRRVRKKEVAEEEHERAWREYGGSTGEHWESTGRA